MTTRGKKCGASWMGKVGFLQREYVPYASKSKKLSDLGGEPQHPADSAGKYIHLWIPSNLPTPRVHFHTLCSIVTFSPREEASSTLALCGYRWKRGAADVSNANQLSKLPGRGKEPSRAEGPGEGSRAGSYRRSGELDQPRDTQCTTVSEERNKTVSHEATIRLSSRLG